MMINQQVLSGKWHQVSGKVKEHWGKLSDDDVRAFDGNVEQLVGRIQRKTGETREAIERFLGQVTQEGSGVVSDIRDAVGVAGKQASEAVRDGYDALRDGYEGAEKLVAKRPAQAVAVAFGLGLLSGIGVALLLHERKRESRFSPARTTAEHLGKHILDGLARIVPESLADRVRAKH